MLVQVDLVQRQCRVRGLDRLTLLAADYIGCFENRKVRRSGRENRNSFLAAR
jgi:hypothetical protein